MKLPNFIPIILIFLSLSSFSQTDFCKGWENGFKEGYCYGDYGCISPIAPVCLVPNIGESSYKDGYNRGFVFGKNQKENGNSSNGKGGAYGQLKPIDNNNFNRLNNQIREYARRRNELAEKRRTRNTDTYSYYAKKGAEAFKLKKYEDCIYYLKSANYFKIHIKMYAV